jgi:hypothetical protein
MLENQENPEARERGQFVINAVRNTFNYDTISLLNISGKTVLSTNPGKVGQDRSQRPEVINAQRGVPAMSDVATDPDEEQVFLHFTAPVYGLNKQQMIGIVDGRVALDEIHRLVALDKIAVVQAVTASLLIAMVSASLSRISRNSCFSQWRRWRRPWLRR